MLRLDLLGTIKGSGAFRRFMSMIRRRGIEQIWRTYRDVAIEKIATDFLGMENIPFSARIAYSRKLNHSSDECTLSVPSLDTRQRLAFLALCAKVTIARYQVGGQPLVSPVSFAAFTSSQ